LSILFRFSPAQIEFRDYDWSPDGHASR